MKKERQEAKLVNEQKEYDYLDYKKAKKHFERERKRAEKRVAREERRAAKFGNNLEKMKSVYSVLGFAGWMWFIAILAFIIFRTIDIL